MIQNKTRLKILFCAVLFFTHVSLMGQNALLHFAETQKENENIRFAASEFERAFNTKPKYSTAIQIAESYDRLQDYGQAFTWWQRVIDFEESTREDFYRYLMAGMRSGDAASFEELLNGTKYKLADFPEIEQAFLARIYAKRPTVKLQPVVGMNSEGSDYGPEFWKNKHYFFTSDRGEVIPFEKKSIRLDAKNQLDTPEKYRMNNRQYFSIYLHDSLMGEVRKLNPPKPGIFHFSDPHYVAQDSLLFYSVTREITKVKKQKEFTIYPELYISMVGANGELIGAEPFPLNDSPNYGVITPFLDISSRRLYFSSNMEGGFGGYDLYYVPFGYGFVFGEPVNLGPEINTAADERDPHILKDRFYFSSDGHQGLGGLDVFEADFSVTGIKNIRNMGVPINSIWDDFAYRKLADGEVYLSSNRIGGMGMDDIYLLKEVYKAFLINVLDCEGNLITENLNTEIRDNTHNAKVITTQIPTGQYLATIEPDSKFEVDISKPGYFKLKDQSLSTIAFEGDTLKKSYVLRPIPYQLGVYVDLVYYDLDKFAIRKDAVPALEKIANIMKKYSFLDLLVSSHTDSRASDEYNIRLSNERSKAVTEYMTKHNISADRIRLEWFGEQQLGNDCVDGKPCPESAHQLNRRSELLLEAFPDPSKSYEIPEELKNLDYCNPEAIMDVIQRELRAIPTIYFDFDNNMLRSADKLELERTAAMLKRMPNLMLHIEGHTDQRGDEAYNQKLSEKRSKVVMEYLKKRGVEANRLEYEWFGETQPIHN